MRCVFTAICALTAEIHCDVGHDASIVAGAMPGCGELKSHGGMISRAGIMAQVTCSRFLLLATRQAGQTEGKRYNGMQNIAMRRPCH